MRLCLRAAGEAARSGEAPIGAAVTVGGELLCATSNLRENIADPLGHAEIRAIATAARLLNRWRLEECTLYVTLEPCLMCSGAILQARVGRVVYGCSDPKAGAVESLYQCLSDPRLNHRPEVTSGVLATDCSKILTDFFRDLRKKKARGSSAPK